MALGGQSRSGYHRIATAIECPQKYAYNYLLGLRSPGEGPATGLGTVVHEYLAAVYLGMTMDSLVLAPRYHPHVPRGREIADAYFIRYPRAAEPFDVLEVEHEIEVGVGPYALTRKIDLVVRHRDDGKVWFYDHKTAGRPTDRLAWSRADWALTTQELVGRAVYGDEWGGLVLNLISTGGPPPFVRRPIQFAAYELAAIPRSLLHYYRLLESLASCDPYNYPRAGSCVGRYGMCEYRMLCESGPMAARAYMGDRGDD